MFFCIIVGGQDEDWSLRAETSAPIPGDISVPQPLLIKAERRLPDFGIFFTTSVHGLLGLHRICWGTRTSAVTRTLPIVIEIKPYHEVYGAQVESVGELMKDTRAQIEQQVQFAFNEYTVSNIMHVVLVVGFHWDIMEFKRDNVVPLPNKRVGPVDKRKCRPGIPTTLRLKTRGAGFVPRELLNQDKTDFSNEF